MRKDELLYVHQLLATVKQDLEERGDLAGTDAYAEVSVSPVAAYAQKGDHEAAVMALAADIAASLDDENGPDEQPQPVSP